METLIASERLSHPKKQRSMSLPAECTFSPLNVHGATRKNDVWLALSKPKSVKSPGASPFSHRPLKHSKCKGEHEPFDVRVAKDLQKRRRDYEANYLNPLLTDRPPSLSSRPFTHADDIRIADALASPSGLKETADVLAVEIDRKPEDIINRIKTVHYQWVLRKFGRDCFKKHEKMQLFGTLREHLLDLGAFESRTMKDLNRRRNMPLGLKALPCWYDTCLTATSTVLRTPNVADYIAAPVYDRLYERKSGPFPPKTFLTKDQLDAKNCTFKPNLCWTQKSSPRQQK